MIYEAGPTKLVLGNPPKDVLEKLQIALAYDDMRLEHEIRTWKKVLEAERKWEMNGGKGYRHWYPMKYGKASLESKIKHLQNAKGKSLLFHDGKNYWTYTGLGTLIQKIIPGPIRRCYDLPEYGSLPWYKVPDRTPRWYQSKSVELLLPDDYSRTLGGVELATGLGKTLIEMLLVQKAGLPSVVVVPTLNIAYQTLKEFHDHFGGKYVGQYFDGKKKPEKLITIAVAKSLQNVEEGDDDWKIFSQKKELIVDEAHTTPPDSLQGIVLGCLGNIPYRQFLSGTQIRTDGLELLLNGIIGDIVLRMNVRQGVEQGFLSPFKMIQVHIDSEETNVLMVPLKDGRTKEKKIPKDDVLNLNRIHTHRNKKLYKHAAELINAAVRRGERVVVLTDEIGQFKWLMDAGIEAKAMFAHGGVTKENQRYVPKEHWESDPFDLVEKFDAGEFPILVGTSCIGMGTDIKSASFIVDIFGNASEIRLRQGVGRGSRLFPGKKRCIYVDYCIKNVVPLAHQGKTRMEILDDIYGPVQIIDVK